MATSSFIASPFFSRRVAASIPATYEQDNQIKPSTLLPAKRRSHWAIRRKKLLMPKCSNNEEGSTAHKKLPMKQRRVVVTGLGVVTPLGHDPDVLYNNMLEGVSGISEIERFDCSKFPTVHSLFGRITQCYAT